MWVAENYFYIRVNGSYQGKAWKSKYFSKSF